MPDTMFDSEEATYVATQLDFQTPPQTPVPLGALTYSLSPVNAPVDLFPAPDSQSVVVAGKPIGGTTSFSLIATGPGGVTVSVPITMSPDPHKLKTIQLTRTGVGPRTH